MAYDAAGNWVPGPNDHNVLNRNGTFVLEAGLGADEPDKTQAARARAAGTRRMEALRAEVAEATAQLAKKEESLAEREARIAAREAELEARERASAKGADDDEDDETADTNKE